MKAMSECVTPLKRAEGGVFETRRMFHAASAAFTRMMRRAWLSIITESVTPARSPTRGSGLGGVAELLVIGVGALEDDIDVQAAKTDIAAREAAAIDPAARLREADAMVVSSEGANGTYDRIPSRADVGVGRGATAKLDSRAINPSDNAYLIVASIFSMRSISVV